MSEYSSEYGGSSKYTPVHTPRHRENYNASPGMRSCLISIPHTPRSSLPPSRGFLTPHISHVGKLTPRCLTPNPASLRGAFLETLASPLSLPLTRTSTLPPSSTPQNLDINNQRLCVKCANHHLSSNKLLNSATLKIQSIFTDRLGNQTSREYKGVEEFEEEKRILWREEVESELRRNRAQKAKREEIDRQCKYEERKRLSQEAKRYAREQFKRDEYYRQLKMNYKQELDIQLSRKHQKLPVELQKLTIYTNTKEQSPTCKGSAMKFNGINDHFTKFFNVGRRVREIKPPLNYQNLEGKFCGKSTPRNTQNDTQNYSPMICKKENINSALATNKKHLNTAYTQHLADRQITKCKQMIEKADEKIKLGNAIQIMNSEIEQERRNIITKKNLLRNILDQQIKQKEYNARNEKDEREVKDFNNGFTKGRHKENCIVCKYPIPSVCQKR